MNVVGYLVGKNAVEGVKELSGFGDPKEGLQTKFTTTEELVVNLPYEK